jgi:uncharacterized LabA/DUF88 family protein
MAKEDSSDIDIRSFMPPMDITPVRPPARYSAPKFPPKSRAQNGFEPLPITPALAIPQPTVERGRVVVIIDGASLFYSTSQLGIEIDYKKLLHHLTIGGSLLRALFYTGCDASNEKQKGFLLWMRHHGFRVMQKELNRLPDGTRKANLEVEMAIDMMQLASHCDTIVLISGNGELAYAVELVAKTGVQVEIVSLRTMLSERLLDVCDRYVDLADIQEQIWIRRPVIPLAS